MFTGIVKEMGRVVSSDTGHIAIRTISADKDISTGDSVAVNGVCLTLVAKKNHELCFDVMAETMRITGLGKLRAGDNVNIEPALRAGEALGGHFVLGHIDCVSVIRGIYDDGRQHAVEIEVRDEFSALVVEKGSIAIDGVSLTTSRVGRGTCTVYIIPHTLKSTTLGLLRKGDKVNVEFDVLGKYVLKKARDHRPGAGLSESFLKEHGF
jgi:riboflavin synthase